ncbi:winged helix-turn-helix transcriptional regulator, partial [bacterium]|nr:winged helix-turn-helix transcriptional regulator [bacterium]
RKVHGLPQKEIADRLGVSLSAVEKHLRLGTLSCRDYIRRHDEQQPRGAMPRVAAKVVPLGGTQS